MRFQCGSQSVLPYHRLPTPCVVCKLAYRCPRLSPNLPVSCQFKTVCTNVKVGNFRRPESERVADIGIPPIQCLIYLSHQLSRKQFQRFRSVSNDFQKGRIGEPPFLFSRLIVSDPCEVLRDCVSVWNRSLSLSTVNRTRPKIETLRLSAHRSSIETRYRTGTQRLRYYEVSPTIGSACAGSLSQCQSR